MNILQKLNRQIKVYPNTLKLRCGECGKIVKINEALPKKKNGTIIERFGICDCRVWFSDFKEN